MGNVVVNYVYDAWGNHKVVNASGVEITDANHIGNLNPFRYRSYYYDTEFKLYYLQTRYYDPEVGRFISQDGIEYADPETINGLNLYVYCGNNPVMNVDPDGRFFWWIFLAVVTVSLVVNGIDGGVTAVMNGQSFWRGFAAGAIGGAIGGAISMFPGLGAWGNIIGRTVSSAVFGVVNELFQNGSLSEMNWDNYFADVFMDFAYSFLYTGYSNDLGQKVTKYFVGNIGKMLGNLTSA